MKKKIIFIIFMIMMFVPFYNVEAKTLQDLYNELSSLESSYNAAKNKANMTQAEINKVRASITATEKEIFADYSYEYTAVSADVDTEDSETEEDEETEGEMNAWLLASSIAIAGVLLLAIVSLIVRKIVVKIRRKRGYYARTAEKPAKKSKKK